MTSPTPPMYPQPDGSHAVNMAYVASNWQPEGTAPRDGRRIVAYGIMGFESEPSLGVVAWDAHYGGWRLDPSEATEYEPEPCEVTHWLPTEPPC